MTSSLVALLRVAAVRSRTLVAAFATIVPVLAAASLPAQTPARTTLATITSDVIASATDAGPMPSSQRLSLTLTLAQTPDRAAALQQFLTSAVTPGSAAYHQWLTPTQFAASYGATADQLAAATAWAQSQNLSVDAVSPAGTRLTVSGPASTIQSAFAVTLHTYQVNGALFYANATQPSLPSATAALLTDIEGLDNLPRNQLTGPSVAPTTLVNGQPAALSIATLSTLIDQNTAPILTLDATSATGSVTAARRTAYTLLFQQAAAQGVTTLLSRLAVSGGIPPDLADLTVVTQPGDTAHPSTPLTVRPSWQIAQGLPTDSLRHVPDLTASSLTALAQTMSSIELQRSSARQGNIAPILYQLASTPSLYTQPDAVPAGTWEPATGLGLVNLTVLAKAFPQATGTAPATLAVATVPAGDYSYAHGAGFTLQATVTSASGGGTPTGTVTFTSPAAGFIPQTVQLNGSGIAISAPFQLPGSTTYPILVTYNGDDTYATQTNSSIGIYVGTEAAYFTISGPGTATLGGPVAITATVASVSTVGTPTGSITASLTGSSNQTQPLSGSGVTAFATANFTANQAGPLAVTVTCSGDNSFTCSTQQSTTVTVPKVTPTIALSLSNTAPTIGASINYTIALGGVVSSIPPTGVVKIMDGGTQVATITLPNTTASGPLASGTTSHSVTAVYPGDTDYNQQTSAPQTATSGLDPTSITVTPYPASLQYGQTSTLVIGIAPTSGGQVNGAAPSGTVSVTVGSQPPVTSQYFGNGNVNVTVTPLSVGSLPVTVSYLGDANYAASTNTSVTLAVTAFAAVITPTLSYNQFTQGSTQTLTVQFASPINAPVPANAAVSATLNGVVYTQPLTINNGGVNAYTNITIYAPIAGTYQLQATCVPNPDFTCNTPAPITVTSTATSVTTPPTLGTGTTPTTTNLATSTTGPPAGGSVTLTATVTTSASTGSNAITGTVYFYDGTALLESEPVGLVGSSYVATANVTLTGTATHSIYALYSGNTVYAYSSSNTLSITSVAAPAAITLTASTTSTLAGQSVTFTARVTGSTFSGVVPTGSVTFYLAGNVPSALATIGLGYGGPGVSIATYTTTGLPDGSSTVYAVYSGDGNFGAVQSNNVTIGLSDYGVNFTPASLTNLSPGQSGTSTLLVNALGGFGGTIAFGCTPPANTQITCSFSPAVITGAGTTVLTVNTTAAKAQNLPPMLFNRPAIPLAGTAFAALLCLLLPGRGRRRLPTLLLVFLALAMTANLGCSSNTVSNPVGASSSGTPLGTAILTINTAGTDGTNTVHHNYSFQVTVQ
jgi:hypothetical protein